MTQIYNSKEIEQQRTNRINNGLAEALNLPPQARGAYCDNSILRRIFNSSVQGLITLHWVSLTNAYNKNSFL